MPRKLELTFFRAKRQWKRKKYGKVHYLGKGENRWDMASYDAALAKWHELEPKLDEEYRIANDPRTPEQKEIDESWADSKRHISEAGEWILLDRRNRQKADIGKPTVKNMVQRFLDRKRKQAESEQRSAGRYINVKMYADQFVDFVGGDKPVTAIDSLVLLDYHAQALADMTAGKITGWCARDRMQVARQVIMFLWEMGQIELPRNIRSKDLEIKCPANKIVTFEIKKLKDLIDKAPEKLKLWLLLMANCGMTQKDIADLLHEEVDWQRGEIKRKRSKTKDEENVPEVTYTLWPVTFELLKKLKGRKGRVFVNSAGGTLVGSAVAEKGSKFDAILKAYNKFLAEAEIKDGKTLKAIRKTSASKIAEHPNFAKFSQYFLGQAPHSVADKHYVKPTEQQFKQCLVWLGEQYGFIEKRTRRNNQAQLTNAA